MPRFFFKAKDQSGAIVSGEIEAGSLREALERISERGQVSIEIHPCQPGIWPRALERRGDPFSSLMWGRRISTKHVCEVTRRLFDLVDAGIPILRVMEVLERGTAHEGLKGIIRGISRALQSGESLSTAMGKYPEVFPSFYIHMVRSGETSGNLSGALERVVEWMERDIKLRDRVVSSLAYPGIVLGVGVLTVVVLLTVVLPRLMVLFEDFDMTLPWITRGLLAVSGFLTTFWWGVLVAGGVVGMAGLSFLRTEDGRLIRDRWVLRVRGLGEFIRQKETARMARALAILLEGGVPMPVAMETVTDLLENRVVRREFEEVAGDVKDGKDFALSVRDRAADWSELVPSMVSVGEESGHLDRALYKLAVIMERETEASASFFVTILGPLALFLVVGVIGVMILAVLLPLFQMNLMAQ
ncbi:MAG: type II secretion system F family protein [Elusimicrobia bacterium]|nr:type II secretion system F family protein [Elusimicrobiota bacterium]